MFELYFFRKNIRFAYYQNMELVFSILIIAVLTILGLSIYSKHITTAKVTHFSGCLSHRNAMGLYRAYHGRWPEDKEALLEFSTQFGFVSDDRSGDYVKTVDIKNGAMNFRYGRTLEGKTLTLRPAVPAGNPEGPVIWVCGGEKRASQWSVFGKDETNIEKEHIVRVLR